MAGLVVEAAADRGAVEEAEAGGARPLPFLAAASVRIRTWPRVARQQVARLAAGRGESEETA
ncbi:hypothetical protein [Streptomyces sviceus]|uniref:hypothetical protein n=1 Tax=Streptomyces sviceus TaxID=285530 RepID=UPI0001852CD6